MKHPQKRENRRGASAVEFALVAPIFFLVAMGIFEFGRAMMVQQMLINASREGARTATFQTSTSDSAVDAAIDHLSRAGLTIARERVTVSPDPTTAAHGDPVTVTLAVPYSEVGWIPGFFMGGRTLTAATTMSYETTN